jgi:hypothetical protein
MLKTNAPQIAKPPCSLLMVGLADKQNLHACAMCTFHWCVSVIYPLLLSILLLKQLQCCICIVFLFCFRFSMIALLEPDEICLIERRKIINSHICYKTKKLNPFTKLETSLIFNVHFLFMLTRNYMFLSKDDLKRYKHMYAKNYFSRSQLFLCFSSR